MAQEDNLDPAIRNALKEKRELEESIRAAMERLKKVELLLQLHREFGSPKSSVDKGAEMPLANVRAPHGATQELFEHVALEILREKNRPLQSPEFLEEFRKRGHYIGANPLKTIWNRLWHAKRAGKFVNVPNAGYWFPETPLPAGYVPPLKIRSNPESIPARNRGGGTGRPRLMTDEKKAEIEAALRAGKSVKQVSLDFAVSAPLIYKTFPRGLEGLLAKDAATELPKSAQRKLNPLGARPKLVKSKPFKRKRPK